jgi:hypothetical protein
MAVTGLVEYMGTASVIGWAFDPEYPDTRLEITVRIRDQFLASGFADIGRKDLLSSGMGDGRHGFNIDISEASISTEDAAELVIHGICGAEIGELARAQLTRDRIVDLTSNPEAPTSDEKQRPVFILGPARSGTSAMTLALLESGAYIGTGEGHLLPLAHALVGTIDQYYQRGVEDPNTLLGKVPIAAFQKLIRRSFVRMAADLFPTRRWLDKTPTVEMVRASVLMKELWPNARFIFMKRRVIENVLSRQRKFPQDDTERHYSDWLAVMRGWLAVREQLGDSALEVEHRQLVLEPGAVVSTIAEFLQLPQDAAARFRSYLTERRPEQTDSDFGAVYSIERLGLNEYDATRLRVACDPIMHALGYSYSESYFSAVELA